LGIHEIKTKDDKFIKVTNGVIVPSNYKKVTYTDNTKAGVRKKKVQNTITKIDNMIYEVYDKVEELQWRLDELENTINFMEGVKSKLEDGNKVEKEELEECEFLYADRDVY